MQGTYFEKRNEFSEMHYLLPAQQCMFDIDKMKAEWLSFDIDSTKENATYVEYTCLKHGNENYKKFDRERIKWIALFELKYRQCERVKTAMELNEGTASWAIFMLAKQMQARFFFVVATEGKPPFTFYEYDLKDGSYNELNQKLNYDPLNLTLKKETVNHYWSNTLKLSQP